MMQFGEKVPGYDIPVLNEREVRAAAGILLFVMCLAIQRVIYTWDFGVLKYSITFFFFDFLVRVFVSPRFSPTLILGRLVVRNQVPQYVGAVQKKFAWVIGLVLSGTMFAMLNVYNVHSPVVGISCMICQLFLLFESAFGICIGCKVYGLFYGKKAQYCPGEVCEPKSKQAIQFTSFAQFAALVAFLGLFAAAIPLLKPHYSQEPVLIHGMERPK